MKLVKNILLSAFVASAFLPAVACSRKVENPATGEEVILSNDTPEQRAEAYAFLEEMLVYQNEILTDPHTSAENKAKAKEIIQDILDGKRDLLKQGF